MIQGIFKHFLKFGGNETEMRYVSFFQKPNQDRLRGHH